MDAKKCDRCGAFYEQYNYGKDSLKPNSVTLVNQGLCSDRQIKNFDLCPGCMKLLIAFLGGKEGGESDG